jgi:hypothetical protein
MDSPRSSFEMMNIAPITKQIMDVRSKLVRKCCKFSPQSICQSICNSSHLITRYCTDTYSNSAF